MPCSDFRLQPDENLHMCYVMKIYRNKCIAQLNVDQKFIFDFITEQSKRMIYIDRPGGTGKIFLYKTLIHYFLSI